MEMYKKIKSIADDGYSLVELVAAMGLLMLLTSVVGVASYNTINSKQTREAVRLATQAAYNDALSSITDFDDKTTPKGSLIKSNEEAKVEGISFTYAPNDVLPTKDSLCVEGSIKGDIKGEFNYKIGPETCENAELQPLPEAEDQTLPDHVVADDITRILYTCDGLGTRDARLNIANLASGTKATLMGKDGSIIPVPFSASSANGSSIKYRDGKASPVVSNVSNTFKIKNGVEYELIVEGKFANIGTLSHSSGGTTLDMTGCMTDIVQLGKDNGVKEISSFEAKKFSKVSAASIPLSVTSLRYMFDSAPINDAGVSAFDTKNVVDMRGVFNGANRFNQSLANWETAKVTDMSYMFQEATDFNQNLSISGNKWNTQNVNNMGYMFNGATSFNGAFGSWNVGKVTNMKSMFENADSFNKGIFNWNTVNVTNMSRMFYGADSYNQALTKGTSYKWDTSKVTTMESMFEGAISFNNNGFALDWNVSNVANMKAMFKDATEFNRPVGHWNVSKVKDMSFMFNNAVSYNQSMNEWMSASATTMESMFEGATKFNGKVDVWLTDNVTTFKNMFKEAASFNQVIHYKSSLWGNPNYDYYLKFDDYPSAWQGNKAFDWSGMFHNAKSFNNGYAKGSVNTPRFVFNDAYVRDVSYMFAGAESFNQGINQNFSDVSNFESMFEGATDFNNGYAKGSSTAGNWILMWWNSDYMDGTTKRISTSKMFKDATSFNSRFGAGDKTNWMQWNRVTDASSMFEGATSFNNFLGVLSSTGNINNMSAMFRNASSFNQDMTEFNTTNSRNMKSMFEGATVFNNSVATNVGGKPVNWNTAKVTDMSYMFAHSRFNQHMYGSMENVTTTQGMFYNDSWINATIKGMENAPKLETTLVMFLNATSFNSSTVGNWRMPNVTNMERMFRNARNFNGDLRGWEVSNVTNMNQMFAYASSFNNYLLGWDTRNVQDMSFMFAYATSYDQPLTSQHSWNTSSVTNMESMFEGASSFNNRGSANWAMDWNTARVTNMKAMFKGTTSFTKHALNFNTANVTNMSYMFEGSNFNNGITSNIGTAPITWDTGKVTDMSYMFARANYNQNFTGSMANVTTTKGMFQYNTWVFADFTGLRTANKITDMSYMFQGATRYNLRATPEFYTNNVTRFEHMWDGATAFNQDLSGWNVGKMTHYYNFGRNSGLTAAKLPKGFVASSAGL